MLTLAKGPRLNRHPFVPYAPLHADYSDQHRPTMAVTESRMLSLGTLAPSFELPAANPGVDDAGGATRSLDDYPDAEAYVVVFSCNHCPYVKHIEDALVDVARMYQSRGVQFIAICSNNTDTHPQDGIEHMAERASAKGFPFPYLRDDTQEVAQAYAAACTPDFFVFDADQELVYRGRFDETRPNKGAAHGGDLTQALDELLEEGTVSIEQRPSMGCNIKWKPGNEPA